MKKKTVLVLLNICILACLCPLSAAAASDFEEPDFDPFIRRTLESGPILEVPWRNDPVFIAAKERNNCPFLIAAYKTVLKDPLPGEEANVHLAAGYVSGTVVLPGAVFSQNQTAGPYDVSRGYSSGPTYIGSSYTETIGGGVCKIASTLYNTAILANLQIIERHHHSMPVPYVPYGQDATVYYGAKDFRFVNSTPNPLLIWARGIDNILYIGFYGQTTPPEIVWNHDVLAVIKAPVIYHQNDALPPGTEKVIHEGMDGAVIRSWIIRFYQDGTSDIKEMGTGFYNPLSWIVERNK